MAVITGHLSNTSQLDFHKHRDPNNKQIKHLIGYKGEGDEYKIDRRVIYSVSITR